MKNKKNILFYVNSQFGIGHFERCLNIINCFEARFDSIFQTYVIYGGVKYNGFDKLHKSKVCKLVGFSYQSDDNTVSNTPIPLNANESITDIFNKRLEQIKEFTNDIMFDFLFLEYFPFSKQFLRKEVEDLIHIISNRKLKIGSSVRDYITKDIDFDQVGAELFIKQYCDIVFCHGDPNISNFEKTYGNISSFRRKLFYTGYVTNNTEKVSYQSNLKEEKIIVSVGGGKDGIFLFELFFEAIRNIPIHKFKKLEILLFPGFFISLSNLAYLESFVKNSNNFNISIRSFDEYRYYLNESYLSVSMCGYNSAIELIQSNTPYVIFIPRNRTEQLLRAEDFSNNFNTYWAKSNSDLKLLLENALDKKLAIKNNIGIRNDGAYITATKIYDLVF